MAEAENLLDSTHSAESLYANFDDFVEKTAMMVHRGGLYYVGVYAFIRLVKDDIEKGRRVFNWSVKRLFLKLQGPSCGKREISVAGKERLELAESQLGVNPLKSLRIIEAVFVLELITDWAEDSLRGDFPGMTLQEFRKCTPDNFVTEVKADMLDMFYQTARLKAVGWCQEFVTARDCALVISMGALAGGRTDPSDKELRDALSQQMPTHNSLAKQRELPFVDGSLVNQHEVINWVLGRDPRELEEIPF